MIKKDALLELLKKGLDREEKAIPIYTKHLKSAVLWTGLEEKDAGEVRRIVEKLATDSEWHKKIVLSLIDSIERLDKDAF